MRIEDGSDGNSSNSEYSSMRMKFQFQSHMFGKPFNFMIEATYALDFVLSRILLLWLSYIK